MWEDFTTEHSIFELSFFYLNRVKCSLTPILQIRIEIAEKTAQKSILTLTRQGDVKCMVCCDIAIHGSLFGLLERVLSVHSQARTVA